MELGPKRLELLRELVPTAASHCLAHQPDQSQCRDPIERPAGGGPHASGCSSMSCNASTERDIDTAFATLIQMRAGALVIGADTFFISQSEQLAALAVRHAVPAIFQYREFAAAGGLMSYGGSLTDAYRLVGVYTGRILKGEKPADLPVQQSTKLELMINLKTAKALGLTCRPRCSPAPTR